MATAKAPRVQSRYEAGYNELSTIVGTITKPVFLLPSKIEPLNQYKDKMIPWFPKSKLYVLQQYVHTLSVVFKRN